MTQIVIPAWYPEVVPSCLHFIRKFWPECPFGIVVVGTDTEIEVDVPVVYLGENQNFGSNMIRFLNRHYTDKRLIIHMEDYILNHPVNDDLVWAAEELVLTPGISYVRLRHRFTPQHTIYAKDPRFRVITKRADRYSLSLQTGLWDTEIFRGLLRNGENSWQTEVRGSGRVRRGSARGLFLGVGERTISYKNLFVKQHRDKDVSRWMKANW